jgi:hypothetical protein
MMKILLGLLILLNAFVWPQWLGIDGWIVYFGILLVLAGLLKSFKPCCGCKETACCDMHAEKPKKKK